MPYSQKVFGKTVNKKYLVCEKVLFSELAKLILSGW
jgi:hypothetical protein